MATPKLKVPRSEADDVLDAHRGEGQRLLELAADEQTVLIRDQEGYMEWGRERSRWIKRTKDALAYVYDGEDAAQEFEGAAYPSVSFVGSAWQQNFESAYLNVQDAMNTLMSLSERLQYAEEPEPQPTAHIQSKPVDMPAETGSPVIFLVHGHDHDTRDKVRSFLERAGDHKHDIVILDEKASRGQTVVEKLEEHASASQYAVVLLTGDDQGGPAAELHNSQPRARQNVVLELGWFCGEIGREHVAVLYEPGVELPSDIHGLIYISLADDWDKRLARELKAADFDFSLDRL
jgi:predicted nucleotide-binding protein